MKILKLRGMGIVVWLEGNSIMSAQLEAFEKFQREEVVEVTAPASQTFLDLVNYRFGKKFKWKDFAGR